MTGEDPQAWKWFALALHAAVQGACICHLATTARPVGVVTDRNAAEWMAYFEKSRDDPSLLPPRTHLLALPELLKAARRKDSAGDGGQGSAIQISAQELDWLRRFHTGFRNQFTHFEPQGWAIEISGLPGLASLAGRIIGDVLKVGWGFRRKDAAWADTLRADLALLSLVR